MPRSPTSKTRMATPSRSPKRRAPELLARVLIHPSAWKMNSQKFGYRKLYSPGPTHGSQHYICWPRMDIRPGERYRELYTEVEVSRRDFASSIRRTPYHLPHLLCKG